MSTLDTIAAALERFTGNLADHLHRRAIAWTVGLTAFTVLSIAFVTKLELKSDFIELLPQNYQSVKDLRLIIEKVGGVGNLSIAIESSDVKASERFADDLAAVIGRDYADRIRFIDYKIDQIKQFYSDHGALYMSLDDLVEIRRRLEARRRESLPGFTNLLDDEPTPLDFEDIKAKYERKVEGKNPWVDGYYTGEDGHLLVMLLKPRGTSTGMPKIEALLHDLDASMKQLDATKYAPDLKWEFAGSYAIGLDEFKTLKNDIVGTALLCVALICAAIFLFFRRMRAVMLLGLACIASVMWTFGITYFAIGYLNTVTAFLGAIIAGTGINYGIILLARYFEERRTGHEVLPALRVAMQKTAMPTFAAAATTAVAFGVFSFADVKSFSQFGFIGGVGVMLLWVASYTLLPSLLVVSERLWPAVSNHAAGALLSDEIPLGFMAPLWRHPRAVLAFFLVGSVVALIGFSLYLPTSLEYDMSKLRTKSSVDSGVAKLDHRISQIFNGRSMTPAVVYTGSAERSRDVCDSLEGAKEAALQEAIDKNLPEDEAAIEHCRSVYTFLPEKQDEKLPVIADIRRLISSDLIKTLPDDQVKQVEDIKHKLDDRPLVLADLPPDITRYYSDKEGKVGTFVLVDPRGGRPLWIAKYLERFTDAIRRIRLPGGEEMSSSGDSVIFADLLKLLKRESPVATAFSFLAVYLVVLAMFRGFRPSLYVSIALLCGSSLMVGVMALLHVKINFFNFMALPMTFGIGVDYSINLYQRYLEEGPGKIERALRRTGTAVVLCSLTTVIGYSVLIIGDSRALVSLGALAIIGEFTCIASALIFLPALVVYMEKRRKGGQA